MHLADSFDAFLADCEYRGLRPATVRTYRSTLIVNLQPFLLASGVIQTQEIRPSHARKWVWQLHHNHNTICRMVTQCRTYGAFLEEMEWNVRNPFLRTPLPVQPPRPTLPFTDEELAAIFAAIRLPQTTENLRYTYHSWSRDNMVPALTALCRVMLHQGLAIGDATMLRVAATQGGVMEIARRKTGVAVELPVHPQVTAALDELSPYTPAYWFHSGACEPETTTKRWGRRLQRLFRIAGVANGRPHRFRDTFAVHLMLNGVSLEDVSAALGHSSIQTTEKYYAPWVPSRASRLVNVVRETWDG